LTIRIGYKLPKGVRKFSYAPNHHYVELEDDHGRRTHLPATDLMRVSCSACRFFFFVASNYGLQTCPHCSATGTLEKTWGKMQIAFVPEDESDFEPPPQGDGTGSTP